MAVAKHRTVADLCVTTGDLQEAVELGLKPSGSQDIEAVFKSFIEATLIALHVYTCFVCFVSSDLFQSGIGSIDFVTCLYVFCMLRCE